MKLKKLVLSSLIVMCFLCMPFSVQRQVSVEANPGTVYVPGTYPTIQAAINGASPGDTILVRDGTYVENVFVNKTVSLIAENRYLAIIDGGGNDNVIYVTADNATICGFTVRNSGTGIASSGIHIHSSSGNNVSWNRIESNVDGVRIYSSSNDIVSDNIISFSSSDGIGLHSSQDCVISGNFLSDNYDGVALYSSSSNLVSRNVISTNDNGIVLNSYSSDNIFSENTLSNNKFGMWITFACINNIIYDNNFNNVYSNAASDSLNIWNYEGEGNHWSDYSGNDPTNDGIGDVPYNISPNNRDNCPLMGIYSSSGISLEEKAYNVAIVSNSTISEPVFQTWVEIGDRIIRFNATGTAGTVGFCRIRIPNELMRLPYIILVNSEEIIPTFLGVSNETHTYVYFNYLHRNNTITIISSETLRLYNELLAKYNDLSSNLTSLNVIYYTILNNYSILSDNYSQLQRSFEELNRSYQALLILNLTYYDILNSYSRLSENYTQLQERYEELNASYQNHMVDYSWQIQNIRNLMYVFAAVTAVFIMTTIYLSKRVHGNARTKTRPLEDKK